MNARATQAVHIGTTRPGSAPARRDWVAVEEPLEIRVAREGEAGTDRALSVTMRTPGHDAELAVGFLLSEGLIQQRADVIGTRPCGSTGNVIRVELRADLVLNLERVERNFYTTSSCGVCGKTSIEAATQSVPIRKNISTHQLHDGVLHALPAKLRAGQGTFDITGGLHAVGLFDYDGKLLALYEDVGRHNAMDKLIGSRFFADQLPLGDAVLVLSGRASFELVQKAMVAGAAVIAAIGAPSSLAIELAATAGITLAAFLRGDGANVYTHPGRIACAGRPQ